MLSATNPPKAPVNTARLSASDKTKSGVIVTLSIVATLLSPAVPSFAGFPIKSKTSVAAVPADNDETSNVTVEPLTETPLASEADAPDEILKNAVESAWCVATSDCWLASNKETSKASGMPPAIGSSPSETRSNVTVCAPGGITIVWFNEVKNDSFSVSCAAPPKALTVPGVASAA